MQETRWHVFQEAGHRRAGSLTAQRAWARSLADEELAFYAAHAAGWVAVSTYPSPSSTAADRHHSDVGALADVCIELYATMVLGAGSS